MSEFLWDIESPGTIKILSRKSLIKKLIKHLLKMIKNF